MGREGREKRNENGGKVDKGVPLFCPSPIFLKVPTSLSGAV